MIEASEQDAMRRPAMPASTKTKVLDIGGYANPGMHALLIHRAGGWWKVRIGESANGDGKHRLVTFEHVVDGRTAVRAKMKRYRLPGICYANILRRLAHRGYVLLCEPCLGAKDAARSALARKTMADRHANGITFHDYG
jgi:hypothetical protein